MNITKKEPNHPTKEPLHKILERESYTIELNGAELLALIEACRCVGGHPTETARYYTQPLASYIDEFSKGYPEFSIGYSNIWIKGTTRATTLPQ